MVFAIHDAHAFNITQPKRSASHFRRFHANIVQSHGAVVVVATLFFCSFIRMAVELSYAIETAHRPAPVLSLRLLFLSHCLVIPAVARCIRLWYYIERALFYYNIFWWCIECVHAQSLISCVLANGKDTTHRIHTF